MRYPARPIRSRALRLLTLALVTFAAACSKDRLRKVLGGGGDPNVDPAWRADSSLLASKPEVLFRTMKTANGTEVVPIVTIGPRGLKGIRLNDRGWRAFDLQSLHNPATLEQHKDGRSIGPVTMKRGMWSESGPPLDSVPGCDVLLPSGVAPVSDGVNILTTTPQKPIKPGIPISDAELQQAVGQITTLLAPRRFLPVTMIGRYTREVHQVNSGHGGRPTIVVTYNDPEVPPDSTIPDGARPRFLLVFLDYGIYGYKSTWVYSTLGNKVSPPRLFYLDNLDIDSDGHAEVLLGMRSESDPLYTVVMKRVPPVWVESTRYTRRRCLTMMNR